MTAAQARPLVAMPGEPAWFSRRPWLRSAAYAVVFSAATLLGRSAQLHGAHLAIFWPASAVGALWIAGSRRRVVRVVDLVLVLVLTVALRLATGMVASAALPLGIAAVVQALAFCWVYRLGRREGFLLRTPGDLRLLALASAVGALVSSPAAVVGFAHVGHSPLWFVLVQWNLRTFVSTCVLVAVAIRALAPSADAAQAPAVPRVESLLLSVAVPAGYAVVFFLLRDVSVSFAVLPLGVWVALRRSTARATVHVVAAATCLVVSAWAGRGPWASEAPDLQAMSAQAFICALGSVTLVLALHRDQGREHADHAAQAAAEVARAHDLFASVLSAATEHAIIGVDTTGRITVFNEGAERMLGCPADDAIGSDVRELLVRDELDARASALGLADVDELFSRPVSEGRRTERATYVRRDGHRLPVRLTTSPMHDDSGALIGHILLATDITARLAAEAELADSERLRRAAERDLQHRALHDALTGLANRRHFLERLEEAIADCEPGDSVGVLFLDLDGFKAVNDDLGHAAGDELLRRVADLLRHGVRSTDTAARLGGDEFAVVCVDTADPAGIGARVLAALGAPVALVGGEVLVGASIGVAFGGATTAAEDLLRAADEAMYEAKRAGKGRLVVRAEAVRASAS